MKKLLILTTLLISANAMAATTLICNDQNSRSVYKLVLNDSNKLSFIPVLKDSSTLSASNLVLNYNEGESNSAYSLYEGVNAANKLVVVELKNDSLFTGNVADATVYYINNELKYVKTNFLCEVK